jgi:hypothetical protein
LNWLVFTYSLSSQSSSSPRVTLWRRLRRLGAIPLSGVQVLPDHINCLESLQWLAQEVREAKGEAVIMQVEQFDGISQESLINKFREIRREDYAELARKISELENNISVKDLNQDYSSIRETLEKLYKQYGEIQGIDFFDCPEQEQVSLRLKQVSQTLLSSSPMVSITPQDINTYRNVQWVTRPQPHVDRLACVWLIRRFINSEATIKYSKKAKVDEIPFDMNVGYFQHQGNLCTFEVMVKSFGITEDTGLQKLGEIVHEIDLRDGLYLHPQIPGIDTLLRGWLLAGWTDTVLENCGLALFDGLYAACR